MKGPDGTVRHTEVRIGNSVVMMGEASAGIGTRQEDVSREELARRAGAAWR